MSIRLKKVSTMVSLTPFKVKRIKTTLDDYIYTSDDQIIEGEIEEGKFTPNPTSIK
jgi:hypothetical protein